MRARRRRGDLRARVDRALGPTSRTGVEGAGRSRRSRARGRACARVGGSPRAHRRRGSRRGGRGPSRGRGRPCRGAGHPELGRRGRCGRVRAGGRRRERAHRGHGRGRRSGKSARFGSRRRRGHDGRGTPRRCWRCVRGTTFAPSAGPCAVERDENAALGHRARECECSSTEPRPLRPPAGRVVVDRAGQGEPSGRVVSDGGDLGGRERGGVPILVVCHVAAYAAFLRTRTARPTRAGNAGLCSGPCSA